MKLRPIHSFLEELGNSGDGPAELVTPSWPTTKPATKEEAKLEQPKLDLQLDGARAEGFEAGMTQAASQFAAERARLEAAFARRSEEKEAELTKIVANQIADCLRRLEAMQKSLSDQILAALLPIMRHVITESAIAELVASARTLASDGDGVSLELSGPAELVERVRHLLSETESSSRPGIRIVQGSSFEVRVVVDDSALETRIMEWIGKIMEAAG